MDKPYSPACERNRDPILAQLQAAFGDRPLRVLEVGAGTGQHGAYFSAAQPQWHWQSLCIGGGEAVAVAVERL